MFDELTAKLHSHLSAPEASAHCDGPCGVYDPASARIAAEAVLSMTKKLMALEMPDPSGDQAAMVSYLNTFARFVAIKEAQAELAKRELLILWTDYFKPVHLEKYPDLHETFWNAAKLCSAAKHEVNLEKAEALMDSVKKIHTIFWETKGREVAYYTAS